MIRKEMKIDVAAVAKQAFQELGPSEEIDEALLRAATSRYGESGPLVFQAIRAVQGALAKRNHLSAGEALQQLIERQRSINLITCPQNSGMEELID